MELIQKVLGEILTWAETVGIGLIGLSLGEAVRGDFTGGQFTVEQKTRGGVLILCFDQPVPPSMPLLVARLVEERVDHESLMFLMSTAVHDAKSSLAVAAGYLELMQWQNPQDEYVQRAQTQLVRLSERLEEVLGGIASYPPMPLDPKNLIQQIVDELSPYYKSQGIDLTFYASHGRVLADRRRLGQVVHNLLNNAAQAITAPGYITIEMRPDTDWIEIRIRDSGPGVDRDLLSRLFTPSMTTKATGHGLGLAFSRRIVESWGGTLRYEEGNPGAVFVMRLPSMNGRYEPQ
ncbi:MAG: sensor histidine kinase [Sulfobacillus sp.]